ncbi:MAG TPA: glycine cleavage system protein T [Anaerolineae bacterium]|nr:glycine cleavage system protein T [Anaerolineae bacterium]
MKSHYQAVIIGGGIVGTSVLYHLTKFGWKDVLLIERSELTSGSTWHAAGGFHAQNDDPTIASLQGYTIRLYKEIEAESGQNINMHMTGGISLATTPERWEMLKVEKSRFETMDMETHLITPKEIQEMCPIVDLTDVIGGLYDEFEGYMDPHGTTHAYAGAAKKYGGEVILNNRVIELNQKPNGQWTVVTEKGTVIADHVVNAAGLWARKVGDMVGVNLPVTPMMHHYLVTEDIPELVKLDREIASVTDLEGFTYLQPDRKGVLLGVYERDPRHWKTEGADWDFGMTLFPTDIDRISPELEIGFARFPVLQNVGIRRWVNGAFTFTPDGNPLVGLMPGIKNFWVACGCMGGFSQGGAIGMTLANWMIHGDPGYDIFAMDVARYGKFASDDAYLKAKTAQFYARRFVLSYPNEELPAGRPWKTSPNYESLRSAGALYGVTWGMETPQFFANRTDFIEKPTLRHSNAFDFVTEEVKSTREAAGMFESAIYARYEVSGSDAEKWLDHLVASKLPKLGRIKLAPMLNQNGKLMGDLTISRLASDRFWIIGSYYLQEWHMRWFNQHLPSSGVKIKNLSDDWMGFALSGPNSREIISKLVDADMSDSSFSFLSCRDMEVVGTNALVARISLTGELGYEINVPVDYQSALYSALMKAGVGHGLVNIGNRALDSLRLEKSYGIWNAEFTQGYTAEMSYLKNFIAFDKKEFIGRDAALKEKETGAKQTLVTLQLDTIDADAPIYAPVKHSGRVVGFVTSSAYGQYVRQSLALAYVDKEFVNSDLTVDVIGEAKKAVVLKEPAYDPTGSRMRI